MDCTTCGGELLHLAAESLTVAGADATFRLAACMGCGEVTRSEVSFSVFTPA